MTIGQEKINAALQVIIDLGLPKAQQNQRSALSLLALLDLSPLRSWAQAGSPLIGITPMMDWVRNNYQAAYAPNTRENFRRQTMHQFVAAGIALYNPDKPDRPVNSPAAVYQIEPNLLAILKTFGSHDYQERLERYLLDRPNLIAKYARAREMSLIPVRLRDGQNIRLSVGDHSELIKAIVEEFGPRYAPGANLVYAGDTGDKFGYFDQAMLASLGVKLDSHGKMPDVVLYLPQRNWLLLVEAVTSHGPVDGKRRGELAKLFEDSKAGLVYVSAFPNRRTFTKYLAAIAWETEVWIADAPTHLIHFNGDRFLGPHD